VAECYSGLEERHRDAENYPRAQPVRNRAQNGEPMKTTATKTAASNPLLSDGLAAIIQANPGITPDLLPAHSETPNPEPLRTVAHETATAPDDDRCTPERIQEWLAGFNTSARPSCPAWCDGAHAARFEVRPDELTNAREDDLAEILPSVDHEAVAPLPCGGDISIYRTETPNGWITDCLDRAMLYISFWGMPQYLDASKDLTPLVKAARAFATELAKVADNG